MAGIWENRNVSPTLVGAPTYENGEQVESTANTAVYQLSIFSDQVTGQDESLHKRRWGTSCFLAASKRIDILL